MRAVMLASLSMVFGGLCACSHEARAAATGEGTLVLEVGGSQGSLREALLAAGVVMAPPRWLRTQDAAPATPDPAAAPPSAEPVRDREAEEPAQPPEASFRIVELARGQTLIHVAKKHLGNGNRYRELLACNGWTEADARRLREGQKVKVPVEAGEPREPRR